MDSREKHLIHNVFAFCQRIMLHGFCRVCLAGVFGRWNIRQPSLCPGGTLPTQRNPDMHKFLTGPHIMCRFAALHDSLTNALEIMQGL